MTGKPFSRNRVGLFAGHVSIRDYFGTKSRKVTRAELAEAYRLWAKHSDIRTGRVRA